MINFYKVIGKKSIYGWIDYLFRLKIIPGLYLNTTLATDYFINELSEISDKELSWVIVNNLL